MPRLVLVAILFCCAVGTAQDNANAGATQSGGQQGTNANPQSTMDRATGMLYPSGSRAGTISGRVLLSDGSAPSERVRVQRVCGVSVVQEALTDSQGRFSFSPGGTAGVNVDSSLSQPSRNGGGGGGSGGGKGGGGNAEANLWGCELRASLRGYRTEAVPLNVRHPDDTPDVGTIFLRPLSRSKGLTISATTGLAPKEAQKSYEKGLDAAKHGQPDLAQTEFSHAVALYVRFAAAWFELGKIMEQRGHSADARSAYARAIASDADFLNPYERLYLLDVRESKWQEAVNASSRVLRRNPYEFSGAYYINALANLQLGNLDAAERSAREAGRLQGETPEPRAAYVMGLIQARQGHLAEAVDSLRVFVSAEPGGAEQKDAERILANLETRIQNRAARQTQP
jgi:tetratricopeptide (TPR) repeat protein